MTFMEAVEQDADWTTHAVTSGEPVETVKARYLMNKMAEAAWVCGDPGIQYHDNINRWHTSANTAPINASNPCSEYMYLDDSACNLASLNLMKFVKDDGEFDIEGYKHAVRIVFTAQEIIVDNASYPTPKIGENCARLPADRPGLREPRRPAHEPRPGLRLRRRPRLLRRASPRSCRRRRRCSRRASAATRAARSPATRSTASRT